MPAGRGCYSALVKLRAIVPAVALAIMAAGLQHTPQSAATAWAGTPSLAYAPATTSNAAFDYYILNLSWSPEFCYSHPSARECAEHETFVLHGLWPENNDGSYPENCSNAAGPPHPSAYRDIYPDAGLLAHEWEKHGTCSGLSPDAYFRAARSAYRAVTIPPRLAGLTHQASMSPDEILELFTQSNPGVPRSSLSLSCGHNYLTAVEICLDKSLHPTACSGLRSCRASAVRIPAP
jgi:ribonuclease T2